jgi:hypothetical protein
MSQPQFYRARAIIQNQDTVPLVAVASSSRSISILNFTVELAGLLRIYEAAIVGS